MRGTLISTVHDIILDLRRLPEKGLHVSSTKFDL